MSSGDACPLLYQLLAERGLQPRGIYNINDAAEIFGVSARTIQDWVRHHHLSARTLPGRGRFLSADLERFLASAVKERTGGGQ